MFRGAKEGLHVSAKGAKLRIPKARSPSRLGGLADPGLHKRGAKKHFIYLPKISDDFFLVSDGILWILTVK